MTGTLRTLAPAPARFVDPRSGQPAYGSYAGNLPRVLLDDLSATDRLVRRKRWVYLALSTDEVWLSLAIVRTGYVATAFAFAFDLRAKEMLFDETLLAPSFVARVADDAHGAGELARFVFGGSTFELVRRGGELDVHVRHRGLEIDAAVDEHGGAPAIAAIAPLGEGLVDGTAKRVLLGVRGRARHRASGRTFVLDGGHGGYDYTYGLLPRHTKWRWAFAQGRAEDGEAFGFNLVAGFVGAAECAAFTTRDVYPLAEPRFTMDPAKPLEPWSIEGDGIDLVFEPRAVHAQHTNLLLVRSRFVQPVGTFRGTVRIGERDVRVRDLPGVAEDQDVLW